MKIAIEISINDSDILYPYIIVCISNQTDTDIVATIEIESANGFSVTVKHAIEKFSCVIRIKEANRSPTSKLVCIVRKCAVRFQHTRVNNNVRCKYSFDA